MNYDDVCFDELAAEEQSLDKVPLVRMSTQAHRLARIGEISGETALALIIWPNPEDMHRYLESPPVVEEEEPLTEIERTISDVDVGLPSNVRFYHSYLLPLPGMCHAFVKIGYRMNDTVRCSRRASIGDYCRTHAKIIEQVEELAA